VIEAAGTHQLWRGPLDGRGRPVFAADESQLLAHRLAWSNYWGVPYRQMHRRKLMSICNVVSCVQPTHWCLSGPESVYKALGWGKAARRTCRAAFALEGQRGGLAGCWWNTKLIEDEDGRFGPPSMTVKALAGRFDWPVLAVMAAWSERVKRDIKEGVPP